MATRRKKPEQKITVKAYVHDKENAGNLIDVDTLNQENRRTLGNWLVETWGNAIFGDVATIKCGED